MVFLLNVGETMMIHTKSELRTLDGDSDSAFYAANKLSNVPLMKRDLTMDYMFAWAKKKESLRKPKEAEQSRRAKQAVY